MPNLEPQSARSVLMIRPRSFGSNDQTAASNRFQRASKLSGDEVINIARREFDGVVTQLADAGIRVFVYEDLPELQAPDAVFPNNWVSFHADGDVVLYPMLAPNRRLERRMDIIRDLQATHGFRVTRMIDLAGTERHGSFLEGTGSVVLDRMHRVAYACLSPRTHSEALASFAEQLRYEPIVFAATDAFGMAVYHTNVLMSVGSRFAILCCESLVAEDRNRVRMRLEATGHTVIEISREQMSAFAGNVLELSDGKNRTVLVLSTTARDSLLPAQRLLLESAVDEVCVTAIPIIEQVGGGGVRCMLAEIHLPNPRLEPTS